MTRTTSFLLLSIPLLLTFCFTSHADEQKERTKTYFRNNCMSCHTIGGGRLTGPDLKGVMQRKDRAWLKRFILDPPGVLASGDAYALKLKRDARNAVMPKAAGMTPKVAGSLLDLIEEESKLEKSEFAGLQLDERPFTADDVEKGRQIFRGSRRLKNGGASCISCHTIFDIGGLGGGRLGPDLTKVYDRLEGRKGLATWLTAPATPTMGAVFKPKKMEPEEILYLTAYFKHAAEKGSEKDHPTRFNFVLLGLLGAMGVLVVFDVLWRGRFRSVRARLVSNNGLNGSSK